MKIANYIELINKIQQSYDKSYNAIQIQDIEEYLMKRNFPMAALDNLYELITENESYLPKKNKFKEIINDALQSRTLSISGGLHPESPLQQLYRAKDWDTDKIIKNCENIRRKQAGADKLFSWEISFLVIWERLKDVMPEFRNQAKDRIVKNGNSALSSPVDLDDLIMPELKPLTEKVQELIIPYET